MSKRAVKALVALSLLLSLGCAHMNDELLDPGLCDNDSDCGGVGHCHNGQCVDAKNAFGKIPPPVTLNCMKDSDCDRGGTCEAGECSYAAPPSMSKIGSPCLSGDNCVRGICRGADCQD